MNTQAVGWRSRMGILVLGVCLAVLITGCETPAQRLDKEALQQIKPSVTTRQEVLQQFGPPRQQLTGSDRTLFLYNRGNLGMASTYGPTEDTVLKALSVLFGPDDRVLRTHYSYHKIHTYYGAGVVSIGDEIKDADIAKIKPNVTTLKEAERLLGEPAVETLALDGTLVVDWIYQDVKFVGGDGYKEFRVMFNEAGVAVSTRTVDTQ